MDALSLATDLLGYVPQHLDDYEAAWLIANAYQHAAVKANRRSIRGRLVDHWYSAQQEIQQHINETKYTWGKRVDVRVKGGGGAKPTRRRT